MTRYASLSLVAGGLVAAGYIACALLAFAHYPAAYLPTQNWLSDLGNVVVNPDGALFYNLGLIASGALLAPFFLGLARLKIADRRWQNRMVVLTQVFGLLGALAMILSAVFPINLADLHSFWSAALYALLGTAFAFSVAALRYHARCPRALLGLGLLAAVAAALMAVFQELYVLEWITVALFLVYTVLLGLEAKRL